MQDHGLLGSLPTELERITFFDRRKPVRSDHPFIVNAMWIVWLVAVLGGLLLLIYALQISGGDAITTLSIILAVLSPVYIEHIQRPRLRIYAATLEKTIFGPEYIWAVKVLVDHPALDDSWRSLFARHWLEKRTAVGCRARIRFLTKERKPAIIEEQLWHTFAPSSAQAGSPSVPISPPVHGSVPGTVSQWDLDRLAASGGLVGANSPTIPPQVSLVRQTRELGPMPARWAGALQPSQIDAIIRLGGQQGTIHRFIETVDIAPGEDNALDIVVQYENGATCYGWNNEIWTIQNPRESRWKLEPGAYVIEVSISYGDRTQTEYFSLRNTGDAKKLFLFPLAVK